MQFDNIDFIIIGAAKSVTTCLQTQRQSDPAIYMPDRELHYFTKGYRRGDSWHLSQFSEEGAGRIVGEKFNSHLYTPEAADPPPPALARCEASRTAAEPCGPGRLQIVDALQAGRGRPKQSSATSRAACPTRLN